MSRKTKTEYRCTGCGETYMRWAGQCGACGEWNCISPINVMDGGKPKGAVARQGYAGNTQGVLAPLSEAGAEDIQRLKTGLEEYDLVLGGGLVRGGSLVLGGNPGAGKSTLLLQTGCHISESAKVIYCAGEETTPQIRSRGLRLGLDMNSLLAIEITNVVEIGNLMERERPDVIIVDSIQTCYHPDLESEPGNTSQLKTCAAFLNRVAKRLGIALLIVGHINKDEKIAGPMALLHIVDAVLMLSASEDARYRILRAEKNRFGSIADVGIFEMTSGGLVEVPNPSAVFLSHDGEDAIGSVVAALWEGTRPLFVEVQGLLDKSVLSNPRRVSVGIDNNRLAMLLAVINKHGNHALADQDVYVNVVGGLKVTETAVDLPVVIAALSSFSDLPVGRDVVAFGEVGLSGEIRPCMNGQERIREAVKLGFRKIIAPRANLLVRGLPDGVEIFPVRRIADVINVLDTFGSAAG